jgi:hypothetical protein
MPQGAARSTLARPNNGGSRRFGVTAKPRWHQVRGFHELQSISKAVLRTVAGGSGSFSPITNQGAGRQLYCRPSRLDARSALCSGYSVESRLRRQPATSSRWLAALTSRHRRTMNGLPLIEKVIH